MEDNLRLTLSQNIKKRRKEMGLTQTKLAELAEISEPYMNDIERCQTWVSDKTLLKLAKVLNLEVFELFINRNQGTPADLELQNSEKSKNMYAILREKKKLLKSYIDNSLDELYNELTV